MSQTDSGSAELQRRFRNFSREVTSVSFYKQKLLITDVLQKAGRFKRITVKHKSPKTPPNRDQESTASGLAQTFHCVSRNCCYAVCTDGGVLGLAREGRELGRAPALSTILLFFFPKS